jgi:hypothetical protein
LQIQVISGCAKSKPMNEKRDFHGKSGAVTGGEGGEAQ